MSTPQAPHPFLARLVRRSLAALAQDADWKEGDHPRADNGQFGSGGGGANEKPAARKTESTPPAVASRAATPAAAPAKPPKNEHALGPAEKVIESRLATKLGMVETGPSAFKAADPAKFKAAIAEYDTLPDSERGKVLNTDTARELSPDYLKDRTQSAAVHEPASEFIKALYAKKLAEPPGQGEDPMVLFTAGGTGAGKSTAIRNLPNVESLKTRSQLVMDTNMNGYESAKKKIDQALAAGKTVNIAMVVRDPEDALVNGALPRAESQRKKFGSGRTVPLHEHIKTHIGAMDTVQRLAEHYADHDDVHFHIIDNSLGKGNAKERDVAWLRQQEYNGVHQRVSDALEREHEAGRISDQTYRGFAGAADAAPQPESSAGGSGSHRRVQQGPGQGSDRQPQPQLGAAAGACREVGGAAGLARRALDALSGARAVRRAMDAWNEADHPRGEGGQFGAGGGGAKSGTPYHHAAGHAESLSENAKTPQQHAAAAHAHEAAIKHLAGEEFVGKQAAGQKHKAAAAHHRAEYGKGLQGGYQKVADLARTHSANAKTAEQHLEAGLSHQAALEQLGRSEFVGKQAAGQEHRAKIAHHQARYAALTGHADRNRAREDARAAGQAHDYLPPELARRALTAWGATDADEHWITVHGGEGKGTPIKITAGGVVVGGAGGSLNGKVLTPHSKSAPIKSSSSEGSDKPAKAEVVAKALQNRNRNSAASITQMNRIASNPNPRLLMSAPTMNDGAPVVSDLGGKGIAKHTGRRDWVVTGKREIPVRYAIVEAGDLSVSNRADGTKNDDYAKDLDKLTAINNGRTAGVIEAYNRGTADDYRKALAKGERIHGIPAGVVRKMDRPVLVRVMDAADVDSQIGDESNSTMTLSLSAVEQAQNDATRFDPASIDYNEDGTPTDASVRGFINAMPQSEQQSLAPNGRPTRQAVDRMMAATFHAAYGDTELVGLMAQATDPESRNLINGMSRAAGSMAKLKDAGELDIRELVTGAAKQIINAVRSGVSTKKFLKQGDLLTHSGEDAIAALFAENSRSAKAIAEKLDSAAAFAYSEAQRAGVDMFGETIPTASREDVLEHLHA